MVWSHQHPNITYKVPLPFTKYACCTCELALRGNLCKHQVVILLTCTNFIKENIIQYYGTWYGFEYGGFVAMFVDLTYLHIYDNEFNDDKADEDHYEEPWVVDMWGACDIRWYFPQCGTKEGSKPTFKFIHTHGENVCSNGWHNARNHQRNQRRSSSTHTPHHIIVVCYCNRCMKYLPFQGEWSHAFWLGISLC